jgi:serine/threonine protein kinase
MKPAPGSNRFVKHLAIFILMIFCIGTSSLKILWFRMYLCFNKGSQQALRFWLGNIQSRKEKHILWNFGLRLPLNPLRIILWQLCGYLGNWRPCLWNVGRKSSILPHKPEINNEKHNECTYPSIQCEFSFPSDISVVAKLFIMKALQKKPDQRFTIDSLLKDRFLTQCPRYEWIMIIDTNYYRLQQQHALIFVYGSSASS